MQLALAGDGVVVVESLVSRDVLCGEWLCVSGPDVFLPDDMRHVEAGAALLFACCLSTKKSCFQTTTRHGGMAKSLH